LKPQIYMWSETRQRILQRHDFYVAQTKARVLANFAYVERDADDFVRLECDRLSEEPDSEWANERRQEFWSLFHDLRQQIFLGALAGCFHQWEKDLRDFLERELLHDFEPDAVRGEVWSPSFLAAYDICNQYEWNWSEGDFFALLEAGHPIVNVHKHGKGRSLDKLAKAHPEYLPRPSGSASRFNNAPHHNQLEITDAQFDEIAFAIRSFWQAFPERLFLKATAGP
jgi:hypothetical protein